LRRIEIAVRIEPDDAADCVVETCKYTLAGIAASSQHQGKSADLSDLPDNGGERLADGQGCVPAVAKRLFAIDALQSYTDTLAATTFSAPA
jgi:hypothetical protein